MRKMVLTSMCLLFFIISTGIGLAAPFYDGKVMKIVVATGPGGGYDFYARVAAKYMMKYLPGSTIIVKNVPGAGHIIGTNQIYNSKPDGLTFGTFNRGLPMTQLAGLKGVKFDLTQMGWLGSAAIEPLAFVVASDGPFKNIEDVMKAKEVVIGTQGIGTEGHIAAMLFKDMAGLKNLKLSMGYRGSEQMLALRRGEIQGQFSSIGSIQRFINDGYGKPIMFTSKNKVKGYEDVPLIAEIIKEKKYEPIFNLLYSISMLGRPFAGPPGIPEDRLRTLRQAFKKCMEDQEVIRFVEKIGRPLEYTDAEEATAVVRSILKVSPEAIRLIKEAYGVK